MTKRKPPPSRGAFERAPFSLLTSEELSEISEIKIEEPETPPKRKRKRNGKGGNGQHLERFGDLLTVPLSDDALALELVDRFGDQLRFVALWNKWLRLSSSLCTWRFEETLVVSRWLAVISPTTVPSRSKRTLPAAMPLDVKRAVRPQPKPARELHRVGAGIAGEHVVADPDLERLGLGLEEDGRQRARCAAEDLSEVPQHQLAENGLLHCVVAPFSFWRFSATVDALDATSCFGRIARRA
jgi:hypothetical protein